MHLLLLFCVPFFGQTEVPHGELRGSVTDEAGRAIKGANIFAHRSISLWADKIELVGQSDVNGNFILNLPAGAYDILVTAYPRSAQSQTIVVKTGTHLYPNWKLPLARDICDFPDMNCDPVSKSETVTPSSLRRL